MTDQPIRMEGGKKVKTNDEVGCLLGLLDDLQALTDTLENEGEKNAELYCIMLVMDIIAEMVDTASKKAAN